MATASVPAPESAEGGAPDTHTPAPPASLTLRVTAMLAGSVLLGVGVGLILSSALGASPLDAFFSGVAATFSLPISVTIFLVSLVFVAAAALARVRPGWGTFVSAAVSALAVEATLAYVSLPAALAWPLGALAVGVSVSCLIAARLGASPYDQVVIAVSRHTRLPIWASRLVVDVVFAAAAFALGGPVAFFTVAALLVVPAVVAFTLPRLQRRLGE